MRNSAPEALTHVAAIDDHVERAVIEQEFAALKPFRQRFAHGLLDDARTGKADQRTRLGHVEVAEHREAGRNAARGRIGQHGNERHPCLRQPRQRCAGLGHLHQRKQRFLHARAATRREAHQRRLVLDAMFHGALEALADHRAHGPAEEFELERAGDDLQPFERTGDRDQRIALTGGLLRRRETIAVTLAVAKLERIFGRHFGADLHLFALIEETRQPFAAADAHVMAALRTDIEIALELGAVQHCVAGRTLDPQSLGNRTRAALGLDPRGHDFLEPRHVGGRPLFESAADDNGLGRRSRTPADTARRRDTGHRAALSPHWSFDRGSRAPWPRVPAAILRARPTSAGPRRCAPCGAGRHWP